MNNDIFHNNEHNKSKTNNKIQPITIVNQANSKNNADNKSIKLKND